MEHVLLLFSVYLVDVLLVVRQTPILLSFLLNKHAVDTPQLHSQLRIKQNVRMGNDVMKESHWNQVEAKSRTQV